MVLPTDQLKVARALALLWVAVTLGWKAPPSLIVPEMTPVLELIDNAGGRPLAE